MKKSMGVGVVFAAVLLMVALGSASAQTVTAAPDAALAAVFAANSVPQSSGVRLAALACGLFCDT
jgi:hypothetical protein